VSLPLLDRVSPDNTGLVRLRKAGRAATLRVVPGANANQVTHSAFDAISREPNYKQSAVRVELAERPSGAGVR
jgi:hypothetical protein